MTRLSLTSLAVNHFSSSLPNKAWRRYHSLKYFSIIAECGTVHPTQVHNTKSQFLAYSFILIILMNLYRKCFGSIWTFHASRAQRHKDCCVTISQDNHTCEVCHAPLWWLHMLPKGRRTSPERSWKYPYIESATGSVEFQYRQIKNPNPYATRF